jgi:hypothetical protein
MTGTEGVCAATVGADAACARAVPNQCPAHQYCDAEPGEEGTCRDRPGDGEYCLDRSQACADQHACVDDVCVRIGGVGEPCGSDTECYSRDCGNDGTCAGPLECAAP